MAIEWDAVNGHHSKHREVQNRRRALAERFEDREGWRLACSAGNKKLKGPATDELIARAAALEGGRYVTTPAFSG